MQDYKKKKNVIAHVDGLYPEEMFSRLTKYTNMTKEISQSRIIAFPRTGQKRRSGEDSNKTKTQLKITDNNNNKTIKRQKGSRNNPYTNEKCKKRTALEWSAEKKNTGISTTVKPK